VFIKEVTILIKEDSGWFIRKNFEWRGPIINSQY